VHDVPDGIGVHALAPALDALEAKTDAKFSAVFEAIRQLVAPPEPKKPPISFVTPKEK
jgi:hypothetical protein